MKYGRVTVNQIEIRACHRKSEFDFRYNNRSKLGVEDAERVAKIVKGTEGKRLTYRAAGQTAHV